MRIVLQLDGITGLVMHNDRLADPDDQIVRAIKEITSKRTKTDADHAEVARLEWFGGLYHDAEAGIYLPTWNVVRCLEEAGKITKKGRSVIRAVAVASDKTPVLYDGPREPAKLWDRPEFRFRKMVGVGGKRIARMRPIFRRWAVALEAELLTDVMNIGDFEQIAEQAGRSEGLGDARKLGYGRFTVRVGQ